MTEYSNIIILFCIITIVVLGSELYKLNSRFDGYRLSIDSRVSRLQDMIGSLNIKTDKHGILINSAQSFSESTRENLDLLTIELGYTVVNKGKQIEKVLDET